MNKQFTTVINNIPFIVNYTHHNEGEGTDLIKLASFEFFPDVEGHKEEGEIEDKELFKFWLKQSFENNLIEYLLPPDKQAELYKSAGVNKLSIDVTTFVLNICAFMPDDDQRIELESNLMIGNTVRGRRYREQYYREDQNKTGG